MKKFLVLLCTAAVIVGIIGVAAATPITSPSDSGLIGATVIDFEDQTLGTYTSLTINDVTFTANNNDHFLITELYGGSFNTQGGNLQNGSNSSDAFSSITFTFSGTTDGFGFNWGASNHTWRLKAYDSSDNLLENYRLPVTCSSNAGEFYGISANDIAYATLSRNGNGHYDAVLIDNFTYQASPQAEQAVPEPATMLLFGSGLICLIRLRKKLWKS